MRPFEITLIALNFVALAAWLVPQFPRRRLPVLTGLALAMALLHVVVEGCRWQMTALYVLTASLFVLSLRTWRQADSARRSLWPLPGLALLVLFSLPPILLPVPTPLNPTGPYTIGTTTFYWEDPAREEIYAPEPGGPRRMVVQVWYPAESGPDADRAPYLEDIDLAAGAIAENFDLPPFLLGHLSLARANAYSGAPAAPGPERYPVLLFSHGWTGLRVQNTYQVEELASHGYVVFAPDHTYGSAVTVFPDGEVVLNNPGALPPRGTPPGEYDRVSRLLGQAWVGDLRFVLDQAGRIDSGKIESPLAGRLDLERVGVFGHSTGGGAAVELCWLDDRCQAGLAMDAWLIPYSREMLAQWNGKPFLLMQSELWQANRNPPLADELYAHMGADRYRMTIAGTAHYDFTDIPQLTSLGPFLGLGGSSGKRVLEVVNAYTVAFFDHYLKGAGTALLAGPSTEYPEVEIETRE